MVQNKRALGTNYEKIAGQYLEAEGYEIIEYNFRCSAGEIDIVAKDQEYLVFCEVKYRKTERAGHPFEAISVSKQRTLSKCAQYYLHKNRINEVPCRFDVVGILGDEVQLLKNAFAYIG